MSPLEGRQQQNMDQSLGPRGRGADLTAVSLSPLLFSHPLLARFLSCQRSPAAAILELFEEQNGSLQELHYLMTLMERLDCASVIQNYLSGSHGGSPGPVVRGGSWENQGLELELELDEKL